MRILLSPKSKREVYIKLKQKYKCSSIKELALKVNVPIKTLDGWIYLKQRYIPKSFLTKNNILKDVEIIDEQEDSWGNSLGGKISYSNTLKKKGISEIKRRQALGGRNASITKESREKEKFSVDLENPIFLELYGSLMGDGWISGQNKNTKWQVGLCGNLNLDEKYVLFMKNNVQKMFNREGYIHRNKKGNVINFLFRHKLLHNYLHEELGFPKGKKKGLKIADKVYENGFDFVKYIIRGIFDTDGSFYLAKRKNKNLYPMISIHMNSPVLISQIGNILKENGFKAHYCNNGKMVRLSGNIQLRKWMGEIGSSNKKHLDKINSYLNSKREI